MINEFNKIQKALAQAENILLLGHPGPDGDCLGALSAFLAYLTFLNKKAVAVVDEEIKEDFDFLPQLEKFSVGLENLKAEDFDVIIMLDSTSLVRVGLTEKIKKENRPFIINIDHHHLSNTNEGDINLVKNVSATCELVYDYFRHVNFDFDFKTATALLTGILTDTGMFSFANTSSVTIKKAGELVARGANFGLITKRMFLSRALPELKSLGQLLNQMFFNEKTKILSVVLTPEDLAEKEAVFDSLANFLQQAKEPEIIMVVKEDNPGKIKVSLRSKKIDVAGFAKKLGGGGHRLAAGFGVDGRLVKNEKGGWQIE
jgi:bifunctional oligoribonuclease and PAP phosphatase NrnA